MHDHCDVGRLFFRRHTDALYIGRENGDRDGDAILDQHLGGIEIGAEFKGDAQRHVAVARALRRHVEHVFNAIDLLLDRRRDRFRYHLRVRAGIGGRDLDRWWRNVRILRNRKRRKRDHADERNDDTDHARKDRPVDEEVRKVHSNAECGIRNAEFELRLRRAVLIEAIVIAISSLASCLIAASLVAETSSDSSNNSSQNKVSSPSSSTMPILAMKSAVDLARQASDSFRIPHSEFRIYFLGSDFEGVGCAGEVSCSGIGFTGIPGCSSCRRVETTFSPSLRPFFTIRLPSKVLAVSRVRRSIVLSGFTTKAYFTPCCELITLSATSAARYGVAPATRTRTKKPGVMRLGFQFFRTTRARTVPVPGSRRLSTKSTYPL